jgi:hypothetical protein
VVRSQERFDRSRHGVQEVTRACAPMRSGAHLIRRKT